MVTVPSASIRTVEVSSQSHTPDVGGQADAHQPALGARLFLVLPQLLIVAAFQRHVQRGRILAAIEHRPVG
jgi:hypothetical protein